jgi:hypothetical protein
LIKWLLTVKKQCEVTREERDRGREIERQREVMLRGLNA